VRGLLERLSISDFAQLHLHPWRAAKPRLGDFKRSSTDFSRKACGQIEPLLRMLSGI
jgi:hypothetical protein